MKIPENANPYRVIVNGVEHAYEAGEETTVAPGVEELINAADNFPPAAEEVTPSLRGGSLVVILTADGQGVISTDKTAGEIFAALPNVTFTLQSEVFTEVIPVLSYARREEETMLNCKSLMGGNMLTLQSDSMNSVMTGEGGK